MKSIILVSFIFLLAFVSLQGQTSDSYNDFQIWVNVKADYKFNKKWDGSIKLDSRHIKNARKLKNRFVQFAVSYDWFKKSTIGFLYRNTFDSKDFNHRLILQSDYKYRKKPFDIIYRLRLEHNIKENQFKLISRLRNRIKIRYKRKKHAYQPFVSVEYFVGNKKEGFEFNKMRYKTGVDYKISKNQQISLSFIHQKEYNIKSPEANYIWSTSYSYKIN